MIVTKCKTHTFLSYLFMAYAVIALVINRYNPVQNMLCGIAVLIYMLITLFEIKNHYNLWFMTFLMFFFNYSIIVNDYLPGGQAIALTYYGDPFYYGIGIHLMLLFVTVFFTNLLPKIKDYDAICMRKNAKNNSILVVGIIALMLLIIVFGISREVGNGYNVQVTALYEYLYLLAFMALYYSDGNIKTEIFIVGIILVAIVQDLMLGGRITSLQLIVLLIIYYEEWLSKKLLLLGCTAGLMLFNIIGIYRHSHSWASINVSSIIASTLENRFALDTAYFAWYASITNVVTTLTSSLQERLHNLLGFVLSILGVDLEGYVLLPTLSHLKGNMNYGGSLIFTYAYFWLGIIGVIILAFVMAKVMAWGVKNGKSVIGLFVVTILCVTLPRWYLYSPLNFFRSLLLGGICFGVFYIADRIVRYRPLV